MGVTPAVGPRVSENSRRESRAIAAATWTGCWCLTAAPSAAISLPRVPGGTAAWNSGDWPECSSQSGPIACSPGVGHSGRAAAGSFSVAQSAAAASRPMLGCLWASQKITCLGTLVKLRY